MLELNEEQKSFLEVVKNEITNEAKKLAQSYKIQLLLNNDLAKITQEFAEKQTPKLVIIAEKYLHPNSLQIDDLRNRLIDIVIEASTSSCINLLNS
jgi:3-deoxy-D-manno-octulosonic-acid transferase